MAAIVEPARTGALLRAIEVYQGEPLTRLALKLMPYIFPRPIEFRTMEWAHVQLHGVFPEWRVPWRQLPDLSCSGLAREPDAHRAVAADGHALRALRDRDARLHQRIPTTYLKPGPFGKLPLADGRLDLITCRYALAWSELSRSWTGLGVEFLDGAPAREAYAKARAAANRSLRFHGC